MRVEAVRIDGGVGAHCDLYASLHGTLDVGLGHCAHINHLLVVEGRQMPALDHPVFEVERGHQVGAVLFHRGNALVVDVAAVLNRVHASLSGPQNSLRAVRMRCNLAAQAMGIGDKSLYLLQRVLCGLWIVALGEHAAGGADFDQVGPVLDVLPYHVLHRGNAVGHAVRRHVVLDRQQVLIAVAAGDAQRGPAHQHVRTGNLSGVDGVAQVHIGKAAGAHVAHGGDAGHQRGAGVDDAVDGFFRVGRGELPVGIEVRIPGQVRVHINQAR